MKKLLLVMAVCLMGYGTTTAQAIKLNPFALLGGSDLISFEMPIGERYSIQLGGGYGGFKFGSFKYSSYGAGVQFRLYFKDLMDGWYLAPDVSWNGGTVKVSDPLDANSESSINYNGFGGGARIGRQWLFDSGFLIDLNLGAGYATRKYSFSDIDQENQYESVLKGNGVSILGSLGIGYSFGGGGKGGRRR